MKTESIPPLPELEIKGESKKLGISQELIDRAMRIIYERRPDYFARMAAREHSQGISWNDDFAKEFNKYLHDEVSKEVDVKKIKGLVQAILQESRRRARKMYGMNVFTIQHRPPKVIDDETGAELYDKHWEAKIPSYGTYGTESEHYIFVFHVPGRDSIEFYAHRLTEPHGFEIDNNEIREAFSTMVGSAIGDDPAKLADFKAYLYDMFMFRMGLNPSRIIEFRDGVNNPRKRYGLYGGIVQLHPSSAPRVRTKWMPTEETLTQAIEALKNSPGNLWEELKAIEVKSCNLSDETDGVLKLAKMKEPEFGTIIKLQNEFGKKLDSLLRDAYPGIDTLTLSFLVKELSIKARIESGLKVKEKSN